MNNDLINLLSMSRDTALGLFYGMVAITVIFAIIVGLLLWKKGKTWAIISAFGLGIIAMIGFMWIHWAHDSASFDEHILASKDAFALVADIFILLVVIALPIYLFAIITDFTLSDEVTNIKKRTYGVSFASLIGLAIFGIIVALLLTPLLLALPDHLFNVDYDHGMEIGGGEEEEKGGAFLGFLFGEDGALKWFTDWRVLLVVIFGSLYIGIGFRIATKPNTERRTYWKSFFGNINKWVTKYFKVVILLVPFALLTRIAMVGMQDIETATDTLSYVGLYVGTWWLGALIIFFALSGFIVAIRPKNISVKETTKIIADQALVSFSTQSTQASLFETQETTRKLGVCDEISKLTPTKGTFMGMVMCNGFSPMLIVIFVILTMNGGQMDWGIFILSALIIVGLTVSSSGQGSADYVILTAVFGAINLDWGIYAGVLLPTQELNERTIRTSNNALGHVAATLLVEKYHKRLSADQVNEDRVELDKNINPYNEKK